jgi:hypothetical protein
MAHESTHAATSSCRCSLDGVEAFLVWRFGCSQGWNSNSGLRGAQSCLQCHLTVYGSRYCVKNGIGVAFFKRQVQSQKRPANSIRLKDKET